MLQSSAPRRPFLLACAALAASVAAGVATTAQSSTDKWWSGYGSGSDHSRYVPSKQITRDNVSRLQAAWTYSFGDTGNGPIVVRGVIYGRGRNGSLIALDAATGAERWVRERMIGMTSRGMNYWASADGRDQRSIFAMDGLMQEVDANTGKSVISFGTNGAVDLRVGLDGYQLIRNVLAAAAHGYHFVLLCDARRPDLLHEWWDVHAAIRMPDLRTRCRFLLWHEVAEACPSTLQMFLREKYGL